jgi:hypothetical protein
MKIICLTNLHARIIPSPSAPCPTTDNKTNIFHIKIEFKKVTKDYNYNLVPPPAARC